MEWTSGKCRRGRVRKKIDKQKFNKKFVNTR